MLLFNLLLGVLPTFILGANIVNEADEDERRRRRMFLLVYGLWALTLAMWNWMRSYHVAWIAVWVAAGVVALAGAGLRTED